MTTTVSAKPAEVRREWYVVDAAGKTLGRLSSEIARRLKGKHKPIFTPHVDTGDYIVVVNAAKVRVTGNKLQDKMKRTMINADDKLRAVFGGKRQVSMFEMTKLVSKHLR